MSAPTVQSTSSAKHESRAWLEKLARVGYGARGAIYLIIGALALLSALGSGGETTSQKGAITRLLEAPFGWLLVLALGIGLLGYSMWRLCQSVFDADHHGRDGKALAIRGGLLASSVTHFLLGIWAGKVAIGAAASDSGGSKETIVSQLMSQPFGQWLVGALGVILVIVGVTQFAKGHGEKFEKYFTWHANTRRKLIPFCKFGLYVRGVIFAIVGGFIVYAAISTDPSKAGGIQDAMEWLRTQQFGPWLLGLVAIGLLCFGIYSSLEVRYRRINIPG